MFQPQFLRSALRSILVSLVTILSPPNRTSPSSKTMEGCSVCEDSRIQDVSLKSEKIPCSSQVQVLDSIWVPNSPPSFHASPSMINFESAEDHISQRQFIKQVENHDSDDLDGCSHQPSKKRRLTQNQVQFLEKSFEVENKLEPDRKNQLAKEVGLQPRQVAIWFQNRRARCKTKVLERDYGSLKACFDKLMADCETLSAENEKLENEVLPRTNSIDGFHDKL
ncbi:hypothetical protein OROGR_002097 [Orobanche gracilis]